MSNPVHNPVRNPVDNPTGTARTHEPKGADHLPLITERLAKPIQPTMFGAS